MQACTCVDLYTYTFTDVDTNIELDVTLAFSAFSLISKSSLFSLSSWKIKQSI